RRPAVGLMRDQSPIVLTEIPFRRFTKISRLKRQHQSMRTIPRRRNRFVSHNRVPHGLCENTLPRRRSLWHLLQGLAFERATDALPFLLANFSVRLFARWHDCRYRFAALVQHAL